ncbi:MAG TPA: chemotaxis protein CheW [Gammaproteobacteria bacterium]
MPALSPIDQLREIEGKSLSRGALVAQNVRAIADWRGIGFRIGETELVTSMQHVSEVLKVVEYTRIPSSKLWFEGIANVRGQLVPVTDFYSFLYGERLPVDRDTRMIMFRLANSVSGLVVTGVTGIRSFREDTLDQDATDVDDRFIPYLSGCFHQNNVDYPVFDFSRLLNDERFMHVTELHG